MLRFVLFCFFASINIQSIETYKPVVIIHGWKDDKEFLQPLVDFITKAHPGTNVTLIHVLHGILPSSLPLWYQVHRFGSRLREISKQSPDGIHLIGYSQGGVIARGIIENYADHNVDTFISFAAPQGGLFGVTRYAPSIPYYQFVKDNIYLLFYTPIGQIFSFANYWRDPKHQGMYKLGNWYLPRINNEVKHRKSNEFKENFLKIKKLVLIGSLNDTMITPIESSHFGFLDQNGNILHLQKQRIFTEDTFGLRTLYQRKAISMSWVTGLDHQYMPVNEECVNKYVIPHLT